MQSRGKGHPTPKKLEGGLQKYLAIPFTKGTIKCKIGPYAAVNLLVSSVDIKNLR